MLFRSRVGQEVMVYFEDGNPDRPIVFGGVNNAWKKPNAELPKHNTRTSFRSRTIDSNDLNQGHELRFEDLAGSEEVYLKSQKDLHIDVAKDAKHTIATKRYQKINGKQAIAVCNGQMTLKASDALVLQVGSSQIVLDQSGVQIDSAKIQLLTSGSKAGKGIARKDDAHTCPEITDKQPHNGGPVLKGSKLVMINNHPAARKGDPLHCDSSKDTIKEAIDGLILDGKPAAYKTAVTEHGGKLVKASADVISELPQSVNNMLADFQKIVAKKVAANTPPKPFQCPFNTFYLQEQDRKFKLAMLHSKPTRGEDYVLQVVAKTNKPAMVDVTFNANCQNPNKSENPNCNAIVVSDSGSDTPLVLRMATHQPVYPKSRTAASHSFLTFVREILIPKSSPRVYSFAPSSCTTVDIPVGLVEVFPKQKWEGEISLGYEVSQEDVEVSSWFGAKHKERRAKCSWVSEGSINITRDTDSWEIGTKFSEATKNNTDIEQNLFKSVQSFFSEILPKLATIFPTESSLDAASKPLLTFKWPNLKLSGGVETVESASSYGVDYKGSIDVGFNPLLAIEAEVDILDWLCLMVPGFGKFIQKIKRWLAKGIGTDTAYVEAELSAIFTTGFDISTTFSWEKQIGESWQTKEIGRAHV